MDNYPPDTGYIVGRPFKTTQGWSWPGEPAPEEVVRSGNLYALISSGMVYPYVPEDGYSKLPPHVFNAVRTYQEVNDIIARGEAPIAMDWTPPQKLEQAQALIDAENESREANQVVSQVQAETWTRKLEVNQISPRPVELPREEIFVDAKHDEALKVAEQDEDGEIKDGTSTPTYRASDDDPVKPEFDDDELTKQFQDLVDANQPATELQVDTTSPEPVLAAQRLADELGKTDGVETGVEDVSDVEATETSAGPVEQEDYSGLTNDQLRDKLKERGLATSGNKAELVSRLADDDANVPDALPDSNVNTPVEAAVEPSDEVRELIEEADERVEDSREEGLEVAEAYEPQAHEADEDEPLIPDERDDA